MIIHLNQRKSNRIGFKSGYRNNAIKNYLRLTGEKMGTLLMRYYPFVRNGCMASTANGVEGSENLAGLGAGGELW